MPDTECRRDQQLGLQEVSSSLTFLQSLPYCSGNKSYTEALATAEIDSLSDAAVSVQHEVLMRSFSKIGRV